MMSKPCMLCGSRVGVQSFIGGPVALRCKKCTKVLSKWEEAKRNQKEIWRQANGVEEAKEDDWGIDKRRVQIEVIAMELRRVIDNENKGVQIFGEGTVLDTKKLESIVKVIFKATERLKKVNI